MGALLREKFEKIASDKPTYDKVMGELIAKVAHLNSEIKPSDLNAPILKLDNSMTDAQNLHCKANMTTLWILNSHNLPMI